MNKKYLLALAASTLMFAACGDDVTEVNEIHQDGMAVLEAGEKLSEQACDTTNVGEMLFVMDSSAAFVCDGKSWQTLKGADGKDVDSGAAGAGCSAKPVKNKAGRKGVEVSCGGAVVDTIWNGENGKPGDPGDAGTSCSAKSVKNKAGLEGLEVTCGKTVIDTIWNGKAGESGNDGVGCSLKDDGDGKVTVTCGDGDDATTATLYKAVCGTKPYDPAKSLCSEGKLYSCDDKPYDPKKQFCKQGSTVEDYGWLTDTRDKQIYKTVKIGDQTWMAENLNYSVNPGEQSWCGGGEAGTKNEGDCSVYGRLYTWAAAIDSVALANDAGNPQTCGYGKTCTLPTVVQGVCPEGWHLPSKDEWKALFTAVGGTSYAGQKLKADSDLWYEGTSNDDSFGFAVLPAGHRDNNGSFRSEGYNADFWSSTEGSSSSADYWYFGYGYDNVYYYCDNKYFGFSVRCLRD